MSLIAKKEEKSLRSVLTDLFDNESFFGTDLSSLRNLVSINLPAANVKELDNQFEIELAAPGFAKGDFKVSVENEVLKISAEKKQETKEEKDNYTRREFNYNSFERSFSLPQTADDSGIKAEYKEGLLQLVIPKKETAQKKSKKEINIG